LTPERAGRFDLEVDLNLDSRESPRLSRAGCLIRVWGAFLP